MHQDYYHNFLLDEVIVWPEGVHLGCFACKRSKVARIEHQFRNVMISCQVSFVALTLILISNDIILTRSACLKHK
jgi:hypothetical protein